MKGWQEAGCWGLRSFEGLWVWLSAFLWLLQALCFLAAPHRTHLERAAAPCPARSLLGDDNYEHAYSLS